jgi:hypothetical protein
MPSDGSQSVDGPIRFALACPVLAASRRGFVVARRTATTDRTALSYVHDRPVQFVCGDNGVTTTQVSAEASDGHVLRLVGAGQGNGSDSVVSR